MVRYQDTIWCDGCGVEMRWEPIEKDNLIYCCREYMLGNRCQCEDFEDEFPSPQNIPDNTTYTAS